MSKKNKKVICIKADNSKDYEQVIFIMRDGSTNSVLNNKGRINFVVEAERIINEKIMNSNIHKAQQNAVLRNNNGISQLVIKKSSTFDIVLNMCMLAGCLFLTAALVYLSK